MQGDSRLRFWWLYLDQQPVWWCYIHVYRSPQQCAFAILLCFHSLHWFPLWLCLGKLLRLAHPDSLHACQLAGHPDEHTWRCPELVAGLHLHLHPSVTVEPRRLHANLLDPCKHSCREHSRQHTYWLHPYCEHSSCLQSRGELSSSV